MTVVALPTLANDEHPKYGELVAVHPGGMFHLYRSCAHEYTLVGHGNGYSSAWLTSQLPSGDWFTEWQGEGDDMILRITR